MLMCSSGTHSTSDFFETDFVTLSGVTDARRIILTVNNNNIRNSRATKHPVGFNK